MMASEGKLAGRPFIRPETVRLFTTRADTTGPSTRALGWDTRALPGEGPVSGSSAGTLFGKRSFGHTGFTGTSLWIDPDVGVFVILLSNRVYPTRNNQRHGPVRSALADLVHGAIRSDGPLLPATGRFTIDPSGAAPHRVPVR
jgi:CubicO group peptidase (beta-lactamase class C family)